MPKESYQYAVEIRLELTDLKWYTPDTLPAISSHSKVWELERSQIRKVLEMNFVEHAREESTAPIVLAEKCMARSCLRGLP